MEPHGSFTLLLFLGQTVFAIYLTKVFLFRDCTVHKIFGYAHMVICAAFLSDNNRPLVLASLIP